jgi:serine phosphatase RsbU (regulator of sigma subunit)
VTVLQWRELVERELELLAPDADEQAQAEAIRRAFGATSVEVVQSPDPEQLLDRASCAIVLVDEPLTFAILRFASKRNVPTPLGHQLALAALRTWREHTKDQTTDEHAAAQDATVDELRDALRELTAVTDRERRTREWLERSLLPEALLPIPRLQISSRYLPGASVTDLAGGDFYDAVRFGDSVTLIIGDVQGKGVEAATLTSLARHTMRSSALRGERPAALLQALNRALIYGQDELRASGSDAMPRFVTSAVAQLTPRGDDFSVTIARAGHPPPVVVRATGDIELIEPKGVLLGVAEDPVFEQEELELHLADTLLLYTDGVTEHREPATQFDERQLGLLVRNRRDTARAESIAQLVLDTVLLLAPAGGRDDIALLVASVSG